jgi:hypothetical protein
MPRTVTTGDPSISDVAPIVVVPVRDDRANSVETERIRDERPTVLIEIRNPQFGRAARLEPGDSLVFGRAERGAGQLPDSSLVSHRHGVIAATETGFTVESIGTYSGFVVRDTMTPSRLHLPRGVGPIEVPFANAVISFDHSVPGQLVVAVVGSERADLWEANWRPEVEHDATVREYELRRSGRTQPPPGLRRKARGAPYTWFWTLVALCEGEITGASIGAPTNAELSQRLGYDTNIIDRHIASIYEALDIFQGEHTRPRDVAVRRAVDRGLVTRDHVRDLHDRLREPGR